MKKPGTQEQIGNPVLQNSIRCLQHPAVLSSIVLLLINDHVLKALTPSWLTGKLSDFAGMFFFPFLIAAGLAVLLGKRGLPVRHAGAIAFGSVALWFILLKTVPLINMLTAGLASWCLGFPTHYSLDPTDLISLLIIIPAWMIWTKPGFGNRPQLAYLSLALGSMAVIATSPPAWEVDNITNLEYHGDGIVLAAEIGDMGTANSYPVAISRDGGLTWEGASIDNIEERSSPIKHCSSLHPEICYRLPGSGRLQELSSQGKWMDVAGFEIVTDNGPWYPIAYDVILFEWEEKEYVMVAIGRLGIMRRELPDGDWHQVRIQVEIPHSP